MTLTLPMPAAVPHRTGLVRRTLLDSAYAASAFFLGLLTLVVVVVGVSLGVGLLVLGVGLAVLSTTGYAARGLAHVERRRQRWLLGREAPTPTYLRARPGASAVSRVTTPLRDPQTWLDLLWGVLGVITGTLAFSVVLAWWAGAGGGLTYWFWQRYLPHRDVHTLAELIGLGSGRGPDIALNTFLGVIAVLTLPLVARLMAAIHAGLSGTLLCARAELQQEVRRQAGGRDAARQAEAQSLRRLERDIHDGPQQRLVRLTMDLGRARRQLDQDPQLLAATLDGALLQARETVEELRSLSRGIAPPLLVDRGLRVALEEMVRGSSVPVSVEIDLPTPLPPHVETAVYFVAAEALTNVNKHSSATAATLTVDGSGPGALVVVTDDGIGGAHSSKGLGLAGLQQRLTGLDGLLDVTSPVGGPTIVRAVIPR